jgi:outer membrane receptor protein involved in Fe transport
MGKSGAIAALAALLAMVGAASPDFADTTHAHSPPPSTQSVSGTVRDALGRPLEKALVLVRGANGRVLARTASDAEGHFFFTHLGPGVYAVAAEKVGFKTAVVVTTLTVGRKAKPLVLTLEAEQALSMPLRASRVAHAQNRLSSSGNSAYTLTQQDISDLPRGEDTPINDVLLQMPGVVRDSNGQVHIRGNHADYQWQINGVMLPLGTTSGFGQFLSARFIDSISLLDGILPTQYGYRNAGVIDIKTKEGCASQGGNFEMYGGQRETMMPNFEYGGCSGNFSYYVTGFYLQDNIGFSQATPGPTPLHDFTNQGQGFGYFSYSLSPTTRLSLITGIYANNSQIPTFPGEAPAYNLAGVNPATYPSTMINESLFQQNYFAVVALSGVLSSKLDYQIAYAANYVTIHFVPDPIGDLIYQGAASDVFHSDLANTLEADFTYHLNEHHTVRTGFYVGEYGVELDDSTLTFPGDPSAVVCTPIACTIPQTSDVPIDVVDNFNEINWLFGVYAQDQWQLTQRLSLNYGLRWDQVLGFTNANQLSPRINALFQLDPDTAFHAGFARYFQTPSFETIEPKNVAAFADTVQASVVPVSGAIKPERDSYFDAGVTRRLGAHLSVEEDAYFDLASNLIDLGQFSNIPIFAPFNYLNGRVYGAESSVTYNAGGFMATANFTYSVAQGQDVESGQFNWTPAELQYIAGHYIYLDHEQLYTSSGTVAYRWKKYLFSLDGLFGNGLYGGFANTEKMPINWQVNLGVARSFWLPEIGDVEGRLMMINLFDRTNLLRNGTGIGIFEPAYGPRFALYAALKVPLPRMSGGKKPPP